MSTPLPMDNNARNNAAWDADTAETTRMRQQMVQALADAGELHDPTWRRALKTVPRHALVPVFYRADNYAQVDGTKREQHEEWLRVVYSDETLITQVTPSMVTSSGTMPGLLACMLQALDVRDGQRVLHIGTGTGYTAALLCERLGCAQITSVDIDAGLVRAARHRLGLLGYQPTLTTADGARGYPGNAPYDRILATCAIRRVPAAWLAQAQSGALIVAPLATGLARITVESSASASGRFLGTAGYFMPLRTAGVGATAPPSPDQAAGREPRLVRYPVGGTVFHQHVRFLLTVAAPDIRFGQHGPHITDVLAVDGKGSWARVNNLPDGTHTVIEGGPRNLWQEIEELADLWHALGRPSRDRYGIAIDKGGQRIWLDEPEGPQAWTLDQDV